MRINKAIIKFFKSELDQIFTNYKLYLFGSRTDDQKRGGDIDLLIFPLIAILGLHQRKFHKKSSDTDIFSLQIKI